MYHIYGRYYYFIGLPKVFRVCITFYLKPSVVIKIFVC